MFGDLVVLYLFVGGAGAGTIMACCLLDLLLVRQPFGFVAVKAANRGAHDGTRVYGPGPSSSCVSRAVDYAFAAGFGLVLLGAVSLLADLGRLDRVAALFLSPHPTVLTVGSYALATTLVLGAFLAGIRFLYAPDVPRPLVRGVEVAAVPVALVTMVYTGVLLQDLAGVAFWRTPLVPVLFALSSLSCGIAVVCVSSVFVGAASERLIRVLSLLTRVDAAIIVLEAVCTAAFLWQMGQSDHPGAAASFAALTQGEAELTWWVGFCLCGMLVPLVLELMGAFGLIGRFRMRKVMAIAAALVLVGALCMRWSMVEVGTQREPVLEPAQELVLEPAQEHVSAPAAPAAAPASAAAAASAVPGFAFEMEGHRE